VVAATAALPGTVDASARRYSSSSQPAPFSLRLSWHSSRIMTGPKSQPIPGHATFMRSPSTRATTRSSSPATPAFIALGATRHPRGASVIATRTRWASRSSAPTAFSARATPDLRDNLPPRLGLIQSRNEGKTWTPVSLLGEADFHILRARRAQIVGYDGTSGQILTSRDGGRHWRRHRFVGPLVDLMIAPAPLRTLLATTPAQLLLSRDGGRSWGSLSETTGLLAWPEPRRLYLLASDGRLWLSPDVGKRWRARRDRRPPRGVRGLRRRPHLCGSPQRRHQAVDRRGAFVAAAGPCGMSADEIATASPP
jgi:photosystem II stability/assembly factor-like uncharacterized protein